MKKISYVLGAVVTGASAIAVVAALTGGADPSQTSLSMDMRTDQAADAAMLLREVEVTEDLYVVDCMAEAGFEFYSVPVEATEAESIALIDAQNAYVSGLNASEQTRFDATLGNDEVEGCLAYAERAVSRGLPAGIQELAMTVQLDSVGEANIAVDIAGEESVPMEKSAVDRANSYERDAALAREALARIKAEHP